MRRSGLIRHSCLIGAAFMAASTAAAQTAPEGGFNLTFGIDQRFVIGRNVDLSVPADGTTASSSTRLSFGLSSITPVDRITLDASAALLIENGPSTSGTEFSLARPAIELGYVREIPEALFSATATYTEDDVGAADDDITLTGADGTEITYGVVLRYEALRTSPASIFLQADLDGTDYRDTTDPTLIASNTYGFTVGTVLRFSDVLSSTLSARREREVDDAGVTTVTDIYNASLEQGLVNGSAFATLSHEDDGFERRITFELGRSLALANGGTLRAQVGVTQSDVGGNDLIASVDLTNPLADGAITASVARSASYDATPGETVIDTRVALGWTRNVNERASVAVDLTWELSDAPSERITQTEIGATYSYALSQFSTLDVGMTYQTREDAGGTARSPLIFVGLGRSF